MSEDGKQLSISLYVCKVIALISVITAHTTMMLHSDFSYVIKQRFSSIGVIVFMIISGYLYTPQKYKSALVLIKKKIISVVVPWVFIGTIVFFWGQVHDFSWANISVANIVKFLLGYKSFLYYIPILLVCYIIFYRSNNVTLIASMVITVISLALTSTGALDAVISHIGITNYLNIFNWIGIFALGIIFRKYNIISRFCEVLDRKKAIVPIFVILYLFLCVIIGLFIEKDQAGYFSKSGLAMEIFAFFVVIAISQVPIFRKPVMIQIAKRSYCIYLIHTMILSLVMHIPILNLQLSVFVPLCTVIAANFLIILAEKVSRLLRCEKLFEVVLGIRVVKNKVE